MELGPLLEENGPIGAKGAQSEGASNLADDEEEDEDVGDVLTLPLQAHHAMEKMEEFVHKVWEGRWRVIPFHVLPEWLKDNDYLLHGHRPPMPSFRACFRSIFRIHTETGNIWTHLLGLILFLDGLVLFNGRHVHHRCWAVCCTNPRALFPGQV
uniref:Adiponectin receptor 1a n=2 Tax=Cyprinus carpio TaxID=7962 RepID=A0A8C1GJZ8_CYPCA